MLLTVLPASIQLNAANTVESVHRLALEWAKLREEKTRAERDWAYERELMQSTLRGLEERLQALQDKRNLAEAQTATSRRAAEEDATKAAALSAAFEKMQERLRQVSRELLQWREMLPPRLNHALELPFASLADETLAPADRARVVVTVLDRCAQFNSAITLSEEVLALEGQREKVFEVLYWGLAQAHALDRHSNQAYVGRPGPKGWSWEPRPAAVAAVVAAALAAHREQADPQFFMLTAKPDSAGLGAKSAAP